MNLHVFADTDDSGRAVVQTSSRGMVGRGECRYDMFFRVHTEIGCLFELSVLNVEKRIKKTRVCLG